MQLKKLKREQDRLPKPLEPNNLPVISWESCTRTPLTQSLLSLIYAEVQEQARSTPLILVSGFIHNVSSFLDDHPGGRRMLETMIGKDASAAFSGGVYNHSNAAHNVRRLHKDHCGMRSDMLNFSCYPNCVWVSCTAAWSRCLNMRLRLGNDYRLWSRNCLSITQPVLQRPRTSTWFIN